MADKQAYKEKLRAEIEQWDAAIEEMRAEAKGTSPEVRTEFEKQLAELERRRASVAKQVKELG